MVRREVRAEGEELQNLFARCLFHSGRCVVVVKWANCSCCWLLQAAKPASALRFVLFTTQKQKQPFTGRTKRGSRRHSKMEETPNVPRVRFQNSCLIYASD